MFLQVPHRYLMISEPKLQSPHKAFVFVLQYLSFLAMCLELLCSVVAPQTCNCSTGSSISACNTPTISECVLILRHGSSLSIQQLYLVNKFICHNQIRDWKQKGKLTREAWLILEDLRVYHGGHSEKGGGGQAQMKVTMEKQARIQECFRQGGITIRLAVQKDHF